VQKRWPERLWIVRHGQSAGNVARDAADAAGLPQIDIAVRDADVPLSRLGEEQSVALGRWFSAMAVDERPNVVLISPYRRAKQTAELIGSLGGIAEDSPELIVDERLREKPVSHPRACWLPRSRAPRRDSAYRWPTSPRFASRPGGGALRDVQKKPRRRSTKRGSSRVSLGTRENPDGEDSRTLSRRKALLGVRSAIRALKTIGDAQQARHPSRPL